jgi:hypothetical protein
MGLHGLLQKQLYFLLLLCRPGPRAFSGANVARGLRYQQRTTGTPWSCRSSSEGVLSINIQCEGAGAVRPPVEHFTFEH